MPKLTIDTIPITVPDGTSILEAAKTAGIWIPHFCYHPALGKAGACRVCAVMCLDGPVKGLQMSCMVPAQDGMVVSTTDPEAMAMRAQVIEWLMINHPHDCPVCDEGGECLLQDYTIAGGHGIRRYEGKKRTHLNQYLGKRIEHEMNRCIQCYRCARFYQEYAGGADFGVMGSAARVYYGRFADGALESPFSGNLVDICPTGVFTDKTARFRARYWDYDMAPSVCPHCSIGCNTTPAARYRELLKTMARHNEAVNGWFICDRGRFENGAVNDPLRPRIPLVNKQEASWDEALDLLVRSFTRIGEEYGPKGIAIVGSPRMSLEGLALLPLLAERLGAAYLCCFTDVIHAERCQTVLERIGDGNSASMDDVRRADCIAIMECSLMDEGPMMALAVRQAWCSGARIYVVGSECPVDMMQEELFTAEYTPTLADVPLEEAERPVVICGTARKGIDIIKQAAESNARVAFIMPGPNAFGAALIAREHGAVSLSQAIEEGTVKGVIAVEADIPHGMLDGVPLVAAIDWLRSDTVARADIVIPATAWVEMDGTYINYEGRAQKFRKVMNPGLPVRGLDPERHPPRIHRSSPPGGDIHPSWQILSLLIERLGGTGIIEPLTGLWEPLQGLDPEGQGMRVPLR